MSEGASASERRGARDPPVRASSSVFDEGASSAHPPPASPALRRDRQRSVSTRPSRRSLTASDGSAAMDRRASVLAAKGKPMRDDSNDEVDTFERKDDEHRHLDRGEALIRRRMRERKRERLRKLQQERGDLTRSFTSDSVHAGADDTLMTPPSLRPSQSYSRSSRRFSTATSHGTRDDEEAIDDASTDRDGDDASGDGEGEGEGEDEDEDEDNDGDDDEDDSNEDLEYTLKDRQDALNFEHPFGLPIWKPALYKKSRSITRTADMALKCMPGQHPTHGALPGNVFWFIFFGVWIGAVCFVLSGVLRLLPRGGALYSRVLYGLATYIVWPFGNYVELECTHKSGERHGPCHFSHIHEHDVKDDDSDKTLSAFNEAHESTLLLPGVSSKPQYDSVACGQDDVEEDDVPATEEERIRSERGVYHYVYDDQGRDIGVAKRWCGIVVYALAYILILVPLLGTACLLCWFLVLPIPMARLLWVLLKNLAVQPLALHFRSPLQIDTTVMRVRGADNDEQVHEPMPYTLRPGQAAPRLKPKHRKKGTSKRRSVILLCNYRAIGKEYWKYTVGGVNILFINTLPIVLLTILDFFVLRRLQRERGVLPSTLAWIAGDTTIFVMSLCSVLPLSYFIGMAVASISAQSSIGMGAVINATFGSIIELILYSIALVEGRAGLVEGSLIGSILAGVLLMPGLSMLSGATRRKEQKFNAQSAGVTSTMLIMAIIGITTPTIFYQIYGTFELQCSGCPDDTSGPQESWRCDQCSYEHVPPNEDPFFASHVQGLIYTCAVVLMCAYAIGLWFSLRTHASQIWNNAQATPSAANAMPEHMPPGLHRASVYKRMLPANYLQQLLPTHGSRDASVDPHLAHSTTEAGNAPRNGKGRAPSTEAHHAQAADSDARPEPSATHTEVPRSPTDTRRPPTDAPRSPTDTRRPPTDAPRPPTDAPHEQPKKHHAEDVFLDAAARMYQYIFNQQKADRSEEQGGHDEGGGHDAPSWSRMCAVSVLLACTILYAIIAEILVDVVDVVVKGLGLPEKFVGVTIFALVPNTTEFMNAMSFAMNGNIALSLEIGSAYVLQVCLIQIPVLVGFSVWYNSTHPPAGGNIEEHAFTLLFPRWDIIAILLSIFLLTYTYIEARSNYHRGSILVLAYVVFVAGFYFAPSKDPDNIVSSTIEHSMSWLI